MPIIDQLYIEYSDMLKYFSDNSQPSFASDISKYFTKTMVLSSASYFEHEVRNILIEFVESSTGKDLRVVSFTEKEGY